MREDEDDDLDEDAIPGYAPASPVADKGKARAPEQLASPSTIPHLSGNIGTSASAAPKQPSRQTVGGVRVETRYVVL